MRAISPAFPIGRAATAAVVLSTLFLGGCLQRTVAVGLSQEEAREAAVALNKGGLRCDVVKQAKLRSQDEDKYQLDCHGGDRTEAEASQLLQDNGLPRRYHEAGFEVYKDGGSLIPTASEERAQFLQALSGEATRTVKTIPGVIDARVQVMIPDSSALHDSAEKPHATASVALIYKANCPEPPKDQVAKLVAYGVEGLDEKNIFVMSVPELPQPKRDQLDDLQESVAPSLGLALDYVYWGGRFLLTLFALGAAFRFAPGIIRWVRTQIELLRESLVE